MSIRTTGRAALIRDTSPWQVSQFRPAAKWGWWLKKTKSGWTLTYAQGIPSPCAA